ncbi:ribosome hibernation-promoting factor, HPF/YfiA family [Aureimonas leprariae]|uniref:Ribosome hibernation promoting factor n=1 Tax=Plantimonas leprariae TaxID=2615207 RepID=A0A7V7TYK6_9HYPH|nr:ribosome-associated translation inhibitor RaiA [Aureimonas leprariae]KAB0682876.1 ribosome-associated translation inhibitor RaiA [Aureimonas leprariae]
MSVRVTGKHMDVGETFRSRIEDRLDQFVSKYYDGNYSGTVVVSKDAARFCADCTIHLDSGVVFQATGEAHDPEASFADASERIEKRLRRYKRRLKDHHAGMNGQQNRDIAYAVVAAPGEDDEDDGLPDDYAPAIIAETSLKVGTMSVAGAVMELDRRDGPLFVFRNAGSGEVNIVYRRADGNFGWVDPSAVKTDA